ncbi:hypothetical protein ACXWTF_02360 [Thiomicrolovo sp. ZZH C-3]
MKKALSVITAAAMTLAAGVFDSGTTTVGASVGSGSGYNSTYTIVGVSASYFVLNGLSAGVGYRGWFGGTPTMSELELPVTYFIPLSPALHPYAGAFYRHTYISGDYQDYETVGLRGGIAYTEGQGYIAAGWVQEWYTRSNGDEISRGYPEISIGISF